MAGAQLPARWQASSALHTTGEAPTQAPALHESTRVQASPSLHDRPLATGPHVPFAAAPAATLQATQSEVEPPPQALSQQNPSTQKPLAHCAPEVQEPLGAVPEKRRARTRSTG